VTLRRLATLSVMWWTVHFLLALPTAIAVWTWLSARVAFSPATDVLRSRIDLATMSDLLQPERGGIVPAAWAATLVAAISAALLAPLLVAGSLGVMRRSGNRRLVGTFVSAAADPFWPLLAIGVATRGLAAIFAVLSAATVGFVVNVVGGDSWEPGPFVTAVGSVTAALVVWWAFVAVGDLALVLRTEAPRRSTLSAVAGAAVLTVRRPFALLRIWAVAYLLPTAAMMALYGLLSSRLMAMPVLLVLSQQAVMLVRAGCRVQALASERRLILESRSRSVDEEDQVRPGQDGQRQVEQRQDAERSMHAEQMQQHRAADREHLGDGEPRTDTGMPERVGDQGVSLGQAEGRDAEVREDAVERLRHQEQHDDEVPEPGASRRGGAGGEDGGSSGNGS
jgi:hypothetical protein